MRNSSRGVFFFTNLGTCLNCSWASVVLPKIPIVTVKKGQENLGIRIISSIPPFQKHIFITVWQSRPISSNKFKYKMNANAKANYDSSQRLLNWPNPKSNRKNPRLRILRAFKHQLLKDHIQSPAHLVPVPERPIRANPGLKTLFYFCIYLPMHYLE